jgi:hypothetical protein
MTNASMHNKLSAPQGDHVYETSSFHYWLIYKTEKSKPPGSMQTIFI